MAELPFTPLPISQDDVTYAYGPDSSPRPGVVPGDVHEFVLGGGIRFADTTRRVWIHTPHGHDEARPAAVMLFNDGWWYLDPGGAVRAGIVLDNLARAGALPPLIGVFVDPGMRQTPDGPVKSRNVEYDAFDAHYADFLVEEVLPLVAERHALSTDAGAHGICGGSSGGNAAFTAAWFRPDVFGRALCFNSSFAQMPGSNPYPRLLHETPAEDLRVMLHAAHRDLGWNQRDDNWFAENLRTAAELAAAGYDMRLVVGDGGHSPNHGGVLLPDALRWLWRP